MYLKNRDLRKLDQFLANCFSLWKEIIFLLPFFLLFRLLINSCKGLHNSKHITKNKENITIEIQMVEHHYHKRKKEKRNITTFITLCSSSSSSSLSPLKKHSIFIFQHHFTKHMNTKFCASSKKYFRELR